MYINFFGVNIRMLHIHYVSLSIRTCINLKSYMYILYTVVNMKCVSSTPSSPTACSHFFFEQDISFWSNDTVLFHQSKTPGILYPNDFVHWHHLTFIEQNTRIWSRFRSKITLIPIIRQGISGFKTCVQWLHVGVFVCTWMRAPIRFHVFFSCLLGCLTNEASQIHGASCYTSC